MALVICQNGCHGVYLETTEQFDPDKTPHGGMFRLVEPYKGNGWSSFPEHEGVTGAALECPDCGAPYLNSSNRVALVPGSEEAPKKLGPLTPSTPAPNAVVSPEIIARIMELKAAGKKPKEIGEAVGLHYMKVGAIIKAAS